MSPLLCDAQVEFTHQFYGSLIISNIRQDNGGPVVLKNFLGVKFTSPLLRETGIISFQLDSSHWVETESDISTKPLDDASAVAVTARISVPSAHEIQTTDKFQFNADADWTDKPDVYGKSVELYADDLPDGPASNPSA